MKMFPRLGTLAEILIAVLPASACAWHGDKAMIRYILTIKQSMKKR